MDCKTCQDLLVDHVSGTLAPRLAAEVEAELKRCEDCRALHGRLQSGHALGQQLPMVVVPEALSARIMATAEADLKRRAQAEMSAQRAHDANWFPRWLRALGQVAMGRQVAMATVMVLIAVGTSWIIPELTKAPNQADVAIVSTEDHHPTLVAEPAPAVATVEGEPEPPPAPLGSVAEGLEGKGRLAPAERATEPADLAPAPEEASRQLRTVRAAHTRKKASRAPASLGRVGGGAGHFDELASGAATPATPVTKPKARARPARRPAKAAASDRRGSFAPPPPSPAPSAASVDRAPSAASAPDVAGGAIREQAAAPDAEDDVGLDRDAQEAQGSQDSQEDGRGADGSARGESAAPAERNEAEPSAHDRRRQAQVALSNDCKGGLRQFDALVAARELAGDLALLRAAIPCLRKVGRAAEAARYARQVAERPTK